MAKVEKKKEHEVMHRNKSTKRRFKTATAKCLKCNKPFSYDPADGVPALCKACDDEANELVRKAEEERCKIVYRGVCEECGRDFYVKNGEAEFLKSRGLKMPKRCFDCRKAAKEKRLAEQAEKEKNKSGK